MSVKTIKRNGTTVSAKLANEIERFRQKGYTYGWIALKTGLTEKQVNDILNVNKE